VYESVFTETVPEKSSAACISNVPEAGLKWAGIEEPPEPLLDAEQLRNKQEIKAKISFVIL